MKKVYEKVYISIDDVRDIDVILTSYGWGSDGSGFFGEDDAFGSD